MIAADLKKGDRLHYTKPGDGCCPKDCAALDEMWTVTKVFVKRNKIAFRHDHGWGATFNLNNLAALEAQGAKLEKVS